VTKYLGPALAALVFHALLLGLYVTAKGGDAGILVGVAGSRVGQAPYEEVRVGLQQNGYDGQFYYAIARAPWRPNLSVIDDPALRQARILYPFASWLLSGDNFHRLPLALPAVNLLAITMLAGIGAWMAARYGLSPWYGFFLPLAADASLPALRDLTDVTSTCAACGLLALWVARGRTWALGLAALAALLAREQNVVIVLLVLGGVVSEKRWAGTLGLTMSLVLWFSWLVVLRCTYGHWPLAAAGYNVGFPGKGLLFQLRQIVGQESVASALTNIACLSLLLTRVGLAIYLLWTPADRITVLVALAGAALASVGGVPIYEDKWSYMRVFSWLPLGCWLGCMQARLRFPAIALASAALLPIGVVAWAFHGGSL
jgi:hypothetical protein